VPLQEARCFAPSQAGLTSPKGADGVAPYVWEPRRGTVAEPIGALFGAEEVPD